METPTHHPTYVLGLIASLGFLGGIVVSFALQTFVGLFFVLVFSVYMWKLHGNFSFFRWGVCVVFLCIGFFYYRFFLVGMADTVSVLNRAHQLTGTVISVSGNRNSTFSYELSVPGASLLVFDRVTSSTSALSYGDRVILSGYTIERPVRGQLYLRYPKQTIVSRGGSSLVGILMHIRDNAVSLLHAHLPPESAALASGMLFGDVSGFTKAMKDAFAATGTTHIVALSGYNVMLVAFFVQICLARFFNRRVVFLLALLFIALFVVVTGISASSTRAAIMYGVFGVAYELGRGRVGVLAAVYSAVIMNIFNPTMIVSNVGFQLSFAALLGITELVPSVRFITARTFLRRYPAIDELCATALAAQLATMPLIVWYFGDISAVSVLVNVVVGIFVPLAMASSFVLILITSVSSFFAWPVALFTMSILKIQLAVISFAYALPLHTVIAGVWGKIAVCGVCIGCIVLLLRTSEIKNRES